MIGFFTTEARSCPKRQVFLAVDCLDSLRINKAGVDVRKILLPRRISVTQRLRGEKSDLEAVVGVDAEAQDGGDLNGCVPALGRLEFPAAQGSDDLSRHHA